jgi:hypothetical protein
MDQFRRLTAGHSKKTRAHEKICGRVGLSETRGGRASFAHPSATQTLASYLLSHPKAVPTVSRRCDQRRPRPLWSGGRPTHKTMLSSPDGRSCLLRGANEEPASSPLSYLTSPRAPHESRPVTAMIPSTRTIQDTSPLNRPCVALGHMTDRTHRTVSFNARQQRRESHVASLMTEQI